MIDGYPDIWRDAASIEVFSSFGITLYAMPYLFRTN